MGIVEAIILGLIQGLTEFIPISSSGHLVIAQFFFSGASDHMFLEWINLGTVLALVIFFWPRIWQIMHTVVVKRDLRLFLNIIIAVLPAGIVGFLLSDFIDSSPFFGSIWVVIVMLALVGVLLIFIERLPKLSEVKVLDKLPRSRALTIGVAQIAALIPGTSRSGSTIVAGRLMGLKAAEAAEFSFLISIPIMFGVIAKLLIKSSDRDYFSAHLSTLLVSNGMALASGIVAVGFLMKYLRTHSLAIFGYYRVILAVIIAGVLLVQ